jgi:hypothetical protein
MAARGEKTLPISAHFPVTGQSISTPAARIELVQESPVQFWFASLVSLQMGRLRSGESGQLLPLVPESQAAGDALG